MSWLLSPCSDSSASDTSQQQREFSSCSSSFIRSQLLHHFITSSPRESSTNCCFSSGRVSSSTTCFTGLHLQPCQLGENLNITSSRRMESSPSFIISNCWSCCYHLQGVNLFYLSDKPFHKDCWNWHVCTLLSNWWSDSTFYSPNGRILEQVPYDDICCPLSGIFLDASAIARNDWHASTPDTR